MGERIKNEGEEDEPEGRRLRNECKNMRAKVLISKYAAKVMKHRAL